MFSLRRASDVDVHVPPPVFAASPFTSRVYAGLVVAIPTFDAVTRDVSALLNSMVWEVVFPVVEICWKVYAGVMETFPRVILLASTLPSTTSTLDPVSEMYTFDPTLSVCAGELFAIPA